MTPSINPALSVVVAIGSDTTSPTDTRHLDSCLAALRSQTAPPAMEIIVPVPATIAGLEALRGRYPQVHFLEVADLSGYSAHRNSREHHGELISRGLALVRGNIVALIEDNDIVAPDWSSRVMEAHRGPFAGIGGAIENGIDRPLNWAVYFCDFLPYQRPLLAGESTHASDVNVAYKRTSLEAIRQVWNKEYDESPVHDAIKARGEKLALAPDVVVFQHRRGLCVASALTERFVWGRSFGAWRVGQAGFLRRLFWIISSPAVPIILLARMSLVALRKRRTLGAFLKALPLTCALAVCRTGGELTGYITGRATAASATPAKTFACTSGRAS